MDGTATTAATPNHAGHGEHRLQPVRAQVVEALVQFGREVEDGRAGPRYTIEEMTEPKLLVINTEVGELPPGRR